MKGYSKAARPQTTPISPFCSGTPAAKSGLIGHDGVAVALLIWQLDPKRADWIDNMWWKLGILLIITAGLIFSVIPIRTHAVLIDPTNPPPPTRWSLSFIISHMYVTPSTVALIGAILVLAGFIAFRIVRPS